MPRSLRVVLAATVLLSACGEPRLHPPLDGIPLSDATFAGCGCIGATCDLRHLGVDLDAPIGTPVRAVADGEVIFRAGPDQADGWGGGNYALFVRHDAGAEPLVALYGHIDTALDVGAVVIAGTQIGTVGPYEETVDGGRVEVYTPHLHLGIHPGADLPTGPAGFAVDPLCDAGDTHGWVAPIAFLAR